MTGPVPAEWSPHRAVWLGFPSHADLWQDDLAPAQKEVGDLARALAGPGGERILLMARGQAAMATATAHVDGAAGIDIVPAGFGDVWLRDTGPIFTAKGQAAAFGFNGWGGKYRLEGDDGVAEHIATVAGARFLRHDFILEGGALDHDGQGTALTTRQCLLNPNRTAAGARRTPRPPWPRRLAYARCFGWTTVWSTITPTATWIIWRALWPRASSPVRSPSGPTTPTRPPMTARPRLWSAPPTPAAGACASSAFPLLAADGPGPPHRRRLAHEFPDRHAAVIVPIYDEQAGSYAVEAVEMLFPDRTVIGLPSRALLTAEIIPLHQPTGAGVTARILSVAALQAAFGDDMQANIAKTTDLIRQAAGAERG